MTSIELFLGQNTKLKNTFIAHFLKDKNHHKHLILISAQRRETEGTSGGVEGWGTREKTITPQTNVGDKLQHTVTQNGDLANEQYANFTSMELRKQTFNVL